MLEKFESFVSDNNLFSKDDRILIALSGGVDSVVLATLMHKANYNIALAHCNFHLRDEESNRDRLPRIWQNHLCREIARSDRSALVLSGCYLA